MTSISNAINAYANIAKVGGGDAMEARDAPAPMPGTDFASVLKDAAKVAIGTMKDAESQSAAAIAGKADIREVVAAVANAEMTLETVVTVRDKVINAYNEILRMPI
ncbi:MAG: flagellar hook-basal body complex protein FliE [Rhodospirillaceae bacterium]|nr:flagellar hook-basal body complex protein FliE [Rhodospirillales bacterium]